MCVGVGVGPRTHTFSAGTASTLLHRDTSRCGAWGRTTALRARQPALPPPATVPALSGASREVLLHVPAEAGGRGRRRSRGAALARKQVSAAAPAVQHRAVGNDAQSFARSLPRAGPPPRLRPAAAAPCLPCAAPAPLPTPHPCSRGFRCGAGSGAQEEGAGEPGPEPRGALRAGQRAGVCGRRLRSERGGRARGLAARPERGSATQPAPATPLPRRPAPRLLPQLRLGRAPRGPGAPRTPAGPGTSPALLL